MHQGRVTALALRTENLTIIRTLFLPVVPNLPVFSSQVPAKEEQSSVVLTVHWHNTLTTTI